MRNQLLTSLLAATLGTSILSISTAASAFDLKSRDQAPNEFKSIIQDFRAFVGEEGKTLSPETIQAKQVDLSKLQLKFDHDVNVFFIGETAGGYRNRLDFTATNGTTVTSGKIFGDTSCSTNQSIANFSKFCPNPNDALASELTPTDKPLNVGDWTNIGSMKAGTNLDFLLVANDVNGGISGPDKDGKTVKGVWSLNQALNPDGLQHAVSYYYKDYLILGFEDLWGGGDKDYNDVVFAIDIGAENARYVAGITPIPEPSATMALFGIAGLGLLKTRRRRSTSLVKVDSGL
ncbi:hypothetical protein NIES2107_28150 [Nostoc carneum NIES-2107]|nr:hypothetical protein NIES2107_28150 [Nostoc carneum NIES-2107]